MPKWEAAIATENPKILYRLVKLLKALDIKFVICSPIDHRCEHAHIVISGPDDDSARHEVRVKVTEDFDTDYVRIEIISRLHNIRNPSRAVIGIDPGMTFGVALVIDGVPIYSNSPTSPRNVTNLLGSLLNHVGSLFPQCQKLVRIGTGSRLYTALLLRSLVATGFEPPLELVNEHRTTIIGGARSDESAAILIAGRTGRPVSDSDLRIEPKNGYIRSLKQYVKQLTRGKKSLSSDEVRVLFSGDSTLEEVIEHS